MNFLIFVLRVWLYIKTYIFGAWFLLKQIFSRHRKPQNIQLQTGKVAIITGGDSGIGFYVAKGLVAKNVHVVIAGRCRERGRSAIEEIRKDFPNAKVDHMDLDLSSFKSVNQFADNYLSRGLKLHLLINNAGVMFPDSPVTDDGIESQIQVNFLSHLYLTCLLREKLVQSGADNSWSRVVNVSSCMHFIGSPDILSVINCPDFPSSYSCHKSYADSKLLIILGSQFLDRDFQSNKQPVSVLSVHPGIVSSGLWSHIHWIHRYLIFGLFSWAFLDQEQGADTILYAALSPELEGQCHGYYSNSTLCQPAKISEDVTVQKQVWDNSFSLINRGIGSTMCN